MRKPIETLAIYVSEGHNFRGHHGGVPGTHPIIECESAELVAGKGIVGDRYFGFKEDYKAQVTFFDQAVHNEVCREFGAGLLPLGYRRNVLLSGVDLNTLIGKQFAIDGMVFQGTEECVPCHWMNDAMAHGVEDFLKGRGGLRTKVIEGGTLRVGPGTIEILGSE
ncbi:MAG: molybdenum cofactor biosysynthesis protein [Verrucomicrobiota bacterium]|nr:molybdenum cofactor biosysynthesis protein [Verrucomicrobiota bacterium]